MAHSVFKFVRTPYISRIVIAEVCAAQISTLCLLPVTLGA